MTELPDNQQLIKMLRERLGLSLFDAKDALEIFEEDPSAGLIYAACVIEARKFLINVGFNLPDDQKAEARRLWDREHAKTMVSSMVHFDPSLIEIPCMLGTSDDSNPKIGF